MKTITWGAICALLGILLLNVHNAFYASVTGSAAVLQLNDSMVDYTIGKSAATGAFPFQIIQYMGWGLIAFGIFMVIKHFYNQSKQETPKNEKS